MNDNSQLIETLRSALIHIAAVGAPLDNHGKYDKNGEWSWNEAMPNPEDAKEIKAAYHMIEDAIAKAIGENQ